MKRTEMHKELAISNNTSQDLPFMEMAAGSVVSEESWHVRAGAGSLTSRAANVSAGRKARCPCTAVMALAGN